MSILGIEPASVIFNQTKIVRILKSDSLNLQKETEAKRDCVEKLKITITINFKHQHNQSLLT